MSPSHRKRALLTAAATAGLTLANVSSTFAQEAPVASVQPTRTLLLEVRANGASLNEIARFVQDGDRLRLPAGQFANLSLLAPPESIEIIHGQPWVWLDLVPGLRWSVDGPSQVIDLYPPFSIFRPSEVRVSPRRTQTPVTGHWGALLSWDAFGQWSPEGGDDGFARNVAVHLDSRLFTPRFTVVNRGVFDSVENEGSSFLRLESHADFDSISGSWRFRVGDSYTRAPRWSRSIRFGGMHWARDFSIRPDLVTTPGLVLEEDIATPSTLDLFVNGVQRYSRPVDPGVVRLSDLPVIVGANTIQAVITDQYGRRTEVALPFYATDSLLAPGVRDFSLEAGHVRENYGLSSDDYGAGFVASSYAQGLGDHLTVRTHAAASGDFWTAGAGISAAVGDWLVVEGALMHSQAPHDSGWGLYAAASRSTPVYNASVSYARNEGYTDLAGWFGEDRIIEQATAAFGLNFGRRGQFHMLYAHHRREGSQRSGIVSGSYSVEVPARRRIVLGASGYGDTVNGAWGAFLSLSMPFGSGSHAYLQHGWRDGRPGSDLQVQHVGPDNRTHVRFNAAVGADREPLADLGVNWRTQAADLGVRVTRAHGSTGLQAEVGQSLVLMNGGVFLSSRIDDAFAVVEVPGAAGVSVALENRPIGRTNGEGRLLVPGLQSYLGNAISIDPLDLPIDVAVRDTALLVAPRELSGAVARFEVDRSLSAIIVLALPDGAAPPAGASVSLRGSDVIRPLGFGGEAYLRGLSIGENTLDVRWRGGHCSALFTIDDAHRGLPRIGPVTCVSSSS